MNVSSISINNENSRKNLFIRFSNSFMSMKNNSEDAIEKAQAANPEMSKRPTKMGIENLQEFTIFPKEVVDGKTIITA